MRKLLGLVLAVCFSLPAWGATWYIGEKGDCDDPQTVGVEEVCGTGDGTSFENRFNGGSVATSGSAGDTYIICNGADGDFGNDNYDLDGASAATEMGAFSPRAQSGASTAARTIYDGDCSAYGRGSVVVMHPSTGNHHIIGDGGKTNIWLKNAIIEGTASLPDGTGWQSIAAFINTGSVANQQNNLGWRFSNVKFRTPPTWSPGDKENSCMRLRGSNNVIDSDVEWGPCATDALLMEGSFNTISGYAHDIDTQTGADAGDCVQFADTGTNADGRYNNQGNKFIDYVCRSTTQAKHGILINGDTGGVNALTTVPNECIRCDILGGSQAITVGNAKMKVTGGIFRVNNPTTGAAFLLTGNQNATSYTEFLGSGFIIDCSNLPEGCEQGISIRYGQTRPITLANFVIANLGQPAGATGIGIWWQQDSVADPTSEFSVWNGVFYNVKTGIRIDESTLTYSAGHNDFWRATNKYQSGGFDESGTGDLEVDPQFIGGANPTTSAGFRLKYESELRVGGKCYLATGCVYPDFAGRRHRNPPAIGAWAVGEGDQRD